MAETGHPATDHPPVVALRGIRKSYGDLLVNEGVDLDLHAGEVHALLGENGAGKTTLMRILYGLTLPDAGQILVGNEPVTIASPRDAIAHGIGMVTQHFALVGPMTVTENVVLGDVGLGPVDLVGARTQVAAAAAHLGVRVDPDARVADLSVGEQQRVEILKALSHDARVLILDEPTAVLLPQDVAALFDTIRRLTSEGLAVLFVSHKLAEVAAIADRVSVLRRGRIVESVGVAAAGGFDAARLAELMVGHPGMGTEPVRRGRPAPTPAATVLALDGLTVPATGDQAGSGRGRPALDGVSLQVRAGEILGVAGVSGNGQRELVDVLCGMSTASAGRVLVAGRDVTGARPDQMVAAGVGRIPEDRHASLVAQLSVEDNLVLEDLASYRRGPFLDRRRIRVHARELIDRYAIKAQPTDPVGTLSGGTLQKVLLARVLARDPAALVAAQPTRGLDVASTAYVHQQLVAQRDRGAAVLLVSEDLDELLALSDRVVVLSAGQVVGELAVAEATPARLGLLMAGVAA